MTAPKCDRTTIERLQAEHPELCFKCGLAQPAPYPVPEHPCGEYGWQLGPVGCLLVEAVGAQEHEIAALRKKLADLKAWADGGFVPGAVHDIEVANLQADLSASREEAAKMRVALEGMTNLYVRLVESGDPDMKIPVVIHKPIAEPGKE